MYDYVNIYHRIRKLAFFSDVNVTSVGCQSVPFSTPPHHARITIVETPLSPLPSTSGRLRTMGVSFSYDLVNAYRISSLFWSIGCHPPPPPSFPTKYREWKPSFPPLTSKSNSNSGFIGRASRFCHISSERTMTVAEALYQRGIISYPRTETEKFKREFDIK